MCQTQQNVKSTITRTIILYLICVIGLYANDIAFIPQDNIVKDTIKKSKVQDAFFGSQNYDTTIHKYNALPKTSYSDSIDIFKKAAFSYAQSKQSTEAAIFIEKYIGATLDVSFINHSNFELIKDSAVFKKLQKRYQRNISGWALFCLYVGFIGIFISTILIFRPVKDRKANFLIGCFLLLHSFFVLRISIFITNYEFYLPHTLYVSASFSFLYGPLIYFYFKRINENYTFKKKDLLHLIPTVLFVGLMLPIYMLSGTEKLRIIIDNDRPYALFIMIAKLLSLIIYGVLLISKYLKREIEDENVNQSEINWQRNLILFYSLYTIFYGCYVLIFEKYEIGSLLFNLQVFIMTFLVLYISYNTFFNLALIKEKKDVLALPINEVNKLPSAYKYSSSSLTARLSVELKDKLVYLMDVEKVYRDNDITLQKLADLLDTNRHNTSQVINEHFGLNFFDLINSYRINEAMSILKNDKSKSINIIDVAYEVGFNNKVTFNKSFKKYNHVTPSEYLRNFSV
ncbi:helix-turn-helix domain-containing protein [uncultured Aquimarina sp.]|uniref:helix-turn-helix domain-containing protein n=1 Tax=uncultured Aquimarina sp. TaxID=575652 RepID=UPI00261930B6|nr:helix-turn-helix domain-containing protein [uncultured Aquimarina sp.]